MTLLKTYLLLLPILFLIDYIWLGKLMGPFYVRELGPLARSAGNGFAPVVWAAVLVYLLIPLGIVIFVLPMLPAEGFVLPALGYGLLYGLILYGVFDMTNYSLLANYSLKMAVVDICWGGFLNSTATLCAAVIKRMIS
jgi:uncharacterized membrane protein